MKRLTRAITTGAALTGLLLGMLAATPIASADGTGQIEGGPDVYLVKNITEGGAYGDSISAQACEELQYSIRLHNSGFTAVNNIKVKVDLPAAASTSNTSTMTATYTDGLVPSTTDTTTVNFANAQTISYDTNSPTQLFDGNGKFVQNEPNGIVDGGISVGSLNGSTTEYINFRAKVNCTPPPPPHDVCPNIPGVQTEVPAGDIVDSNGNCVPPPPTPVFSCDAFSITANGDTRTVKVSSFNETAKNGATFNNAVIDWGDNSTPLTSASPVGQTHQYGADGTYTLTATAHFTVNGADKTDSGPQCTTSVTFSTGKPPVVTPPTPTTTVVTAAAPTTLVNTGAGSVLGIFAAASLAGMVIYRRVLSRRLSRQ